MERKECQYILFISEIKWMKETDGQGIGTEVNLLIERKRRKTKLNQRFNLKRHVITNTRNITPTLSPSSTLGAALFEVEN